MANHIIDSHKENDNIHSPPEFHYNSYKPVFPKESLIYMVMWNGGIEYIVEVTNKQSRLLNIWRHSNNGFNVTLKLHFKDVHYKNLFIGNNEDPTNPERKDYPFHGNSVLIQLDDHVYWCVSFWIAVCEIHDQILNYYSPIERSECHIPYAISGNNVYIFPDLDRVKLFVTPPDEIFTRFHKKLGDIKYTMLENPIKILDEMHFTISK